MANPSPEVIEWLDKQVKIDKKIRKAGLKPDYEKYE